MTRSKKNPDVMRMMCARLSATFDATGWHDREISQMLGYNGQATISGVRRGTTFLDTERLATLGSLLVRKNARPNLHWILTGDGRPFLPVNSKTAVASALSTVVLDALQSDVPV